ncbi:MAG: NADH-quinone oxidoreductase subunit C [Candidatus Omnitrophica bacterium]|nr:NADH-quinone oxidoreductase subunit C [Candidatus Omnitrophota bacterium]
MNQMMLIEKIRSRLGERLVDIFSPKERRIFVHVKPEDLVETIGILKNEFGFYHLSTISGVDKITCFEILYHLASSSASLTVRVQINRENPEIQSICGVIPGAILYEREVQDMFGIIMKNIPDSRPLILPDDWPENNYPLRKDWYFKAPEEKIPGENK